MRLGIFSDIHANYEALSAVLEAYRRESDRRLLLPRRHGRLRRLAQRVRRPRARDREEDDPRQPRRRRRRAHGLLVLLRGRAPRARRARGDALAGEHGVARRRCRTRRSSTTSTSLLCHGSPVRLEEFEYIFAPEQARECLPIWDELGHITLIGHSHLCKVFALTPTSVEELPAVDFELEPDKKYIVSVGSVGQPRDYDNRASYTVYDTRQEALRVQAHRVRHRDRRREGAARQARAQLRAPPLHRRLMQRVRVGACSAPEGPQARTREIDPWRPAPAVRRSSALADSAGRARGSGAPSWPSTRAGRGRSRRTAR